MRLQFATGRTAQGPLIWAQLAIWNVFRWLPPDDTTLNLLVECPVPPGRDLNAVTAAIARLVQRHDSLHTLYLDTPDGPVQRVLGEGDIPLRLHDIGERDQAEATAELGEALRRDWFDIGADLPLRVAVLTRDGEPRTVLLAASHMAVDGWSLAIVRADLAGLLQDPPVAPEPGQQPLQRLTYETSAVGRRRGANALAFWARHLDELPLRMIESNRDGQPATLDWGNLQSPALALAVNSLAARLGLPPATVLLTAVTVQLAAYTGEREAALRMIVSTRFRPASRGVVAAFNQNALFRLGIDARVGERIPALLARAADAALAGYAHCEYDARELDAMFTDLAARRGIRDSGYCFFNDTRFTAQEHTPPPDGHDALAEAIHAALPATKLRAPVVDRQPMHANFFLFLTDLSDTAELTLCVEHGYLGSRGPLGYLDGLERTIVKAALNPTMTSQEWYREAG